MVRLLIIVALGCAAGLCRGDDSLNGVEQGALAQYLGDLRSGQPGSAVFVDQLADVPFGGLRTAMQAYADAREPFESHTHRAFQALLERMSRTALLPWPMVGLYSPELAEFLIVPAAENSLSARLFAQLVTSGVDHRSFDLAVRLTPQSSLEYLRSGAKQHRVELLEAWNRRLGRGRERRPLAKLDETVAEIAESFALSLPRPERNAQLKFIASWPSQQERYEQHLAACLESDEEEQVLSGLAVQQERPRLLKKNGALVKRFIGNEKVLAEVLRNYAFDSHQDHSAILRQHWQSLPRTFTKARYSALFAMGVHSRGNDALALQAVLDNAYELIDVALPVLASGDPDKARQAVRHVLSAGERGQEEALRLATTLNLKGFDDDAVRLALDPEKEQILRQTAMLYLRNADGAARRRLAALLKSPSGDLRLTAIQMFGEPKGLTPEDMNSVGPELIRIALEDPSMGYRQEAIYVLGNWRAKLAEPFFRKILADNPPAVSTEGHYNDELYWQYRFRLMALLALAKQRDAAAEKELVELHRNGGPIERMDALLAFLDLGTHVELAWEDLENIEPKLIASGVALIAKHGDKGARERLRAHFHKAPLWFEFVDSGLDDHNILETAGALLDEHAK